MYALGSWMPRAGYHALNTAGEDTKDTCGRQCPPLRQSPAEALAVRTGQGRAPAAHRLRT